MKRTQQFVMFPMAKGLDLNSVPGTQDQRSLIKAKNIAIRTRPSLRKKPGIRRIDYIGNDSGIQGAYQFYGPYGTSIANELIRVRNGKVEALRYSGETKAFQELTYEDGSLVTDINQNDVVNFEPYGGILTMFFSNRRPLYYSIGGYLSDMPIISSHELTPPTFAKNFGLRLWYSGRSIDPHNFWVSAIENAFDYTLNGGGFKIAIKPGDNDPVGLTGASDEFRGSIYAYKWLSVYRIYLTGYGYGVDQITNEGGAVNHKCIVTTQNDIYSVATDGIKSLSLTAKYGGVDSANLTYNIYDWFQENINWDAYDKMSMTYNNKTGNLLFAFPSSDSMVANKILSCNIFNKEMTLWENCEYPALGKYIDFGRKRNTFIACEDKGIGVLDYDFDLEIDQKIDMEIETGIIFPLNNPKLNVTYTQGWLLTKPTEESVLIDVYCSIDGKEEYLTTVDSSSGGYGSLINDEVGGLIGAENIGSMRDDLVSLPFEMKGVGNSIKFRIVQNPPENDKEQKCEIYGMIFEFGYNEDTTMKVEG